MFSSLDIPCSPTCASQKVCVQGVCVGVGHLSVTLTWSRSGDGDLVVTTPNNKRIYYNNKGPSTSTDQGQLDVDDMVGRGPENIFWSSSGSAPPNGTYYVCFEPYSFSTNPSISNPIFVTIRVLDLMNNVMIFQRNLTSYQLNSHDCDASAVTLVGSFSYP